jgi:hypothetical protein
MKRVISKMALVGATMIAALVVISAGLAQQSAAIELWSENSAGQHQATPATPLERVTEHSAGQHVAQGIPVVASESAAATTSARPFSWGDAGVGAGASLLGVLVVATTILVQRRIRPVAANL